MKRIQLLDNSMFDDGSFDCFNFWLATCDGTQQVDAETIKEMGLKSIIEKRMIEGKGHLVCKGLVYGGLEILEIQWG